MEQLVPTNYPYLITRACTALPYTQEFQKLPDGFLRIVLKIVQKIDLKLPFKAIFATRATLAAESGKSIDIVHRAVKWMADNQFLERERKAHRGNRGSSSPLVPTMKLLQCLSLVDSEGKPLGEAQSATPVQQARAGEGCKAVDADAWQGRAGRHQFVRIGPVTLPKDLSWLCQQGVSAFGVLSLMKKARLAGQRLSDVLLAARQYLEGLSSREVYAYLSKLIHTGRDFAGIAESSRDEQKNEEISQSLKNKLEEMEGRSFISRKHQRIYKVMNGALYELRDNVSWTVHLINQAFIDAIHEGRLMPYRG